MDIRHGTWDMGPNGPGPIWAWAQMGEPASQQQASQLPNRTFDRKNRTFDRKNRTFDRKKRTFDRKNRTFDRKNRTFDRKNRTFDRKNRTFDRKNGTWAQIGTHATWPKRAWAHMALGPNGPGPIWAWAQMGQPASRPASSRRASVHNGYNGYNGYTDIRYKGIMGSTGRRA
jgi:hypothetical protein